MSADTELRNAVAERDGWSCRFCRRRLVPPTAGRNHTAAEAGTIATLDHWVPRCRGGSWELANLVIACRTCNEEKGALTGPEYLVVRAFRRLSDPANRAIPTALDERLVAAVACRTVRVLLGKSAATVVGRRRATEPERTPPVRNRRNPAESSTGYTVRTAGMPARPAPGPSGTGRQDRHRRTGRFGNPRHGPGCRPGPGGT